MVLKPWKLLISSGGKKKTKRRKKNCATKLLATRSTKVVEKIVMFCHIAKSKLLMKQLPLLQEEATSPSPIGSSFHIITWFVPMHQTNVTTSSSFPPQVITQTSTTTKT